MSNNHGGKREGAGRTSVYKETTSRLTITVPKSKEKEIMKLFQDILKRFVPVVLLFAGYIANAQDTICLPRNTYIDIYKGLVTRDQYKQAYDHCLQTAISLNEIIQQQNDSLQYNMSRLQETEYELDHLNYQYQEAIKSRPTPWYKSPWTWGAIGLLTGILLLN